MATDIPITDYNQIDLKGQKRAIRPKLLKLTDDTRSWKKNRFKVSYSKQITYPSLVSSVQCAECGFISKFWRIVLIY